jgi:hypothetical protein
MEDKKHGQAQSAGDSLREARAASSIVKVHFQDLGPLLFWQ